jgi:hypothetical protein
MAQFEKNVSGLRFSDAAKGRETLTALAAAEKLTIRIRLCLQA